MYIFEYFILTIMNFLFGLFPILGDDLNHIIPIGLLPVPLNLTQAILLPILHFMTVTILLKLQNKLKLLMCMFHLDLISYKNDLISIGLSILGQEK